MKRLVLLLALASCDPAKPAPTPAPAPTPPAPRIGPDRVCVQHILITFKGASSNPNKVRPKEEAQKLAQELYEKARKGDDFGALVKKFSDDDPLGIYWMCNVGVLPQGGDMLRTGVIKGFADLSFKLKIGDIGIVEHHEIESPDGWHIVKRLDDAKVKNEDRITVQHILIGFRGSIKKDEVTRTKEAAEKLAMEIFERAKKGEDFGKLTNKYSDDDPVGIYSMHNTNAQKQGNEMARSGMVKAFGDVSFMLGVDEIGMAEHHERNSPFGWHIIKRIK